MFVKKPEYLFPILRATLIGSFLLQKVTFLSHLAVSMTPGVVDIPIPTPARTPKVTKRTWMEGANALERIPIELRREPAIVT